MASQRMRTVALMALGGIIAAAVTITYFYRADIERSEKVLGIDLRWGS